MPRVVCRPSADYPFDVATFDAAASELAASFRDAEPFPHVVVDDLLRLPKSAIARFPDVEWHGWNSLGDEYQRDKMACDRIELIPEPFTDLIVQLSAPPFLRALEVVTGIKRLLPDLYLHGGGLHMSGPGGVLQPHTDFHTLRAFDLFRRINLLLYLNTDWTEEDGGCLELFGRSGRRSLVVPQWGRCVIFATDDRSVHGFTVPVADGRYRRSVALYYYTAAETPEYSGDSTTYWREHGTQTGVRRARLAAYRGLLNASRGLSIAAHAANPNVGPEVLRSRLADRRGSTTNRAART